MGSVTIFFSIIILCLITFLATIFDVSRIQFIGYEARDNFQNSLSMGLSQYDPVLMHQYGLFAGKKGYHVDSIITEGLDAMFYPRKAQDKTFMVDYLTSEKLSEPILSIMSPSSYQYTLEYKPFLDPSLITLKTQILEYMKFREPYLLLRPFLDQLKFLGKTSKSSKIIEEKNALIESLSDIDSIKKRLIELIDGIQVTETNTWQYDPSSYYIRGISYNQTPNFMYFPEVLVPMFSSGVHGYEKEKNALIQEFDAIDLGIMELLETHLYEAIDADTEAPGNGISIDDMLNNGINYPTQTYFPEYNDLKVISQDIVNQMIESVDYFLETIPLHEEGVKLIEEYELICTTSLNAIEDFQNKLLNSDELLVGVVDSMTDELNQVKDQISVDETNLNVSDNLALIKERLELNLLSLYGAMPYLEVLKEELNGYICKRYYTLKKPFEELDGISYSSNKALIDIFDLFFPLDFYPSNLNNSDEIGGTEIIDKEVTRNLLTLSESFIMNYRTDLYFNYEGIEIEQANQNEYEGQKNTMMSLDLRKLFTEKGLLDFYPGLIIDQELLPSYKLSNMYEEYIISDLGDPLSDDANLQPDDTNLLSDNMDTATLFSYIAVISESMDGLHDQILLNEYMLGMFGNAADKNDPNAKTMNEYALKDHFLNYEVEYILGGNLDETRNLDRVLGYLYGIRILANGIHLATNGAKRTVIINIANTIAGWWTAGIGAVIIAIIIGAVWALFESVIDVFMLLSGERVPFIKTTSSWYSDIKGNWMDIFNTGVKTLDNEMTAFINSAKSVMKESCDEMNLLFDDLRSNSIEFSMEGWAEAEEIYRNALEEIANDTGLQVDNFSMTIDSKVDKYLTEVLMSLVQNDNSLPENPFSMDAMAYGVVEAMKDSALNRYNELAIGGNNNQSAIIELKQSIMEEYDEQIDNVKKIYREDMLVSLNLTMDAQTEVMKYEIGQMMDEGKKIGKEYLYKKADEIKKEIQGDLVDKSPTSFKPEDLIPSFSYEDYLRLFLLLPIVNENTKLARCMDLVQFNLQKIYHDEGLDLMDYYCGLILQGTIQIEPYFLPSFQWVEKQQETRNTPSDYKKVEVKIYEEQDYFK